MLLFSWLNLKEIKQGLHDDAISAYTVSNFLSLAFLPLCAIVPITLTIYFCLKRENVKKPNYFAKVASYVNGAKFKTPSDV